MLDIKDIIIDEKTYLETEAFNYSLIKEVDTSIQDAINYLVNNVRKDTKSLRKGSLIDDLLSGFENSYVVYEGNSPDGKAREVCLNTIDNLEIAYKEYLEESDKEDSSINRSKFFGNIDLADFLLDSRVIVGYFSNRKDATVLPTLMLYSEFIGVTFINKDKLVISKFEMNEAKQLVKTTVEDEFCKQYLYGDEEHNQAGFVTTLPVRGKNILVKGLTDKLVINHKTKVVTIIDYKSYSGDFISNYFYYKYYIQATLYLKILRKILSEKDSDYTCNFVFIALNKETGVPTVFKHVEHPEYFNGGMVSATIKGYINTLFTKGIESNLETLHILSNSIKNNNTIKHYPWYYENGFYFV